MHCVEKYHFMHLKCATITPVDTRCTRIWAASSGGLKSSISEHTTLPDLKTNTAGVISLAAKILEQTALGPDQTE